MSNKSFLDIWRRAPAVRAAVRNESGAFSEIFFLPGERDEQVAVYFSNNTILMYGKGTREEPYHFPASDFSAHLAVIALWFALKKWEQNWRKPAYIEVNDALFIVTPEGVVAENGVFTRFAF